MDFPPLFVFMEILLVSLFRWNLSRSATNFFFEHRDFAIGCLECKETISGLQLPGWLCSEDFPWCNHKTGRDLVIQIEYLGEEDMLIYHVYIISLYIHIQMISHILSVWTAEIILTSIRAELFPLTPTTFFSLILEWYCKGCVEGCCGFPETSLFVSSKAFFGSF